jgi:FXSXX-COOH protein
MQRKLSTAPQAPEVESELIDLTNVSLRALEELESSGLTETVDRVLERADAPRGYTYGYNPQRID